MRRPLSILPALFLLGAVTAFAEVKQPGDQPNAAPGVPCPQGPTHLCIPLDASFAPVIFDGVGGNGPADPADPCQRNDDDFTNAIPLPFTFTLYGTAYNQVFINNNGNISFGGGFATFTPTGFPVAGFPMVAPLWSDVDTRGANGGGVVWVRMEANRMTVIWDHVGYYLVHENLVNTFELIISDGTDPLVGVGRNVCFCYDDMQWTTGDASGGVGGFGGVPATAGINKGDGVDYALLGLFDKPGAFYDGPGGLNDGIDYLDGQTFCFDASGSNPVPTKSATWGEIKIRYGN
jgi:hypothetical protein